MYYSESMIQMVEDLHHQASAMEKEVKHMMELEGRALGIELDKRKSARDLYNELMEHQNAKAEQEAMTWAYVPCQMAEEDPNCYPAESYLEHSDEMPVEDIAEAPVVEEPVVEAPVDMPVEEHVEPAPAEEHVEPAPVEPAPVDPAPVEEAPVDEVPHEFVESPESAPIEEAPVEEAPIQSDDNPPVV
tara:strand:- start:61 stop:624 length:564 start_codon:yes stop_codon:yes gene_type:complete